MLSEEDKLQMEKPFVGKNGEERKIEMLLGRQKLKKTFQYEVKWRGLSHKVCFFFSFFFFQRMKSLMRCLCIVSSPTLGSVDWSLSRPVSVRLFSSSMTLSLPEVRLFLPTLLKKIPMRRLVDGFLA